MLGWCGRPAGTPAAAGVPGRGTYGAPTLRRRVAAAQGVRRQAKTKGGNLSVPALCSFRFQEDAGGHRRCQPHYRAAGARTGIFLTVATKCGDGRDRGAQLARFSAGGAGTEPCAPPPAPRTRCMRTWRAAWLLCGHRRVFLRLFPRCDTVVDLCVAGVQLGSNPAWHVSNGDALR